MRDHDTDPLQSGEPELTEATKVDFHFETYGDLVRIFGPKRAAGLVRTRERKLRLGPGGLPEPTRGDIEIALRLLRGDKTGAQSSKALLPFRHYFASTEQRRKACESYLVALRDQIPE
jgi:hypothetical protein